MATVGTKLPAYEPLRIMHKSYANHSRRDDLPGPSAPALQDSEMLTAVQRKVKKLLLLRVGRKDRGSEDVPCGCREPDLTDLAWT